MEVIKKIKQPEFCAICDKSDWENLDHLRDHKYWYDQGMRYRIEEDPVGFKICKNCGFPTYNYVEDIQTMYDNQRDFTRVDNLITGNRKNLKHRHFLKDEIYDKGIKKILDVGCAQGSYLDFMSKELNIDKKDCYGTEYAKSAINFGKHYFGLENLIQGDLEPKTLPQEKQFDLISYYHVVEHVEYPDKELLKVRDYLKDDGFLYMSVPYWFERLEESAGFPCMNFENLYHLNHINVFTRNHFRNIIKKTGWEVIKENHQMYGYTVLCKKVDIPEDYAPNKENWQDIVKKLEAQKKAIELLNQKKFEEAQAAYPAYPDAYINQVLSKDINKDFDMQKSILEKALTICDGSLKLKDHIAALHLQWDQNKEGETGIMTNNVREAERLFNELIAIHPSEQHYFSLSLIEGKYKKNVDKAKEYLEMVSWINPKRIGECINFIGSYCKDL